MQLLSFQIYIVACISVSTVLLFGLRRVGKARDIARFRDLTILSAAGYGLLLVTLYQGAAFYNAPSAVFFRWVVQGVVILAIAGFSLAGISAHAPRKNCSARCLYQLR